MSFDKTFCFVVIVIVARIIGFDPVSYTHLDVYKRQIFNSMDKERAEEIRQICNKKNQICTDMITVESVTCVAQRVLSASCFSIS